MGEYEIDHFSRELSNVFVNIFAAIVQIFSVNIIILIERSITYLSCYFAFITILIETFCVKKAIPLSDEVSICSKTKYFYIDQVHSDNVQPNLTLNPT